MDDQQYNRRKQLAYESKQRSMEKRMNRQKSLRVGYDLIDKRYNCKEGHCKLSRQRTTKHETAKAKIQHLCMLLGELAYSEVIFTNGSIGDVYLPKMLKDYEILESETIEQFNEKIKKYPGELTIIPLKADDVLKKDFCL